MANRTIKQKKNSENEKVLIIDVLGILIVTFGTFYWVFQKINQIDESNELSKQIPKSIQVLFYRESTESYPYQLREINWGKKYFLLDEDAPITYIAKRNEELGTNTNFPNGEISGLVMVRTGSKSYRLNSTNSY